MANESIGENRPNPPENPSPQEAWDVRAPTVPLKVGWLKAEDISPLAVFLASGATLLAATLLIITALTKLVDIRKEL